MAVNKAWPLMFQSPEYVMKQILLTCVWCEAWQILTLYCIIDWDPPHSLKWAGAQPNKTPQSPDLGFVQCLQIDLFLAVFLPSSYKTFLMNQSSFDKDRQHSSRSRRDIIFPQNHIKSRKEMKNPHPQTRTQEKFARKVCKLSNNKKNVEIFLFFSSSLLFEPVHED